MVLTMTSSNCKVKMARNSYLHQVEDKQKVNLCTSFHFCSMFHFENTAIWTSKYSQCITPKEECCPVKKSLLLIFSSITISRIRRYVYAHSSWVKRKIFYRKSELQVFLLISGSHIGAPKWYTNMASPNSTKVSETFQQITQKLWAT